MLHYLVPDEIAAGSLEPNLDFYGPRTAHGSTLSPGVHATLLARAGRLAEALEMLRLTARIDLDDTRSRDRRRVAPRRDGQRLADTRARIRRPATRGRRTRDRPRARTRMGLARRASPVPQQSRARTRPPRRGRGKRRTTHSRAHPGRRARTARPHPPDLHTLPEEDPVTTVLAALDADDPFGPDRWHGPDRRYRGRRRSAHECRAGCCVVDPDRLGGWWTTPRGLALPGCAEHARDCFGAVG